MSAGELAALAAIGFSGAFVFGVTGFGAALITIPLATQLVSLKFALPLYALMDLGSALSVGLENPGNAVRPECSRLVPMILAGTLLGVTALVSLPRRAGMLLLGAFVLAFSVYGLARGHGGSKVGRGWAWVAGLAGGVTSSLFGAGGPPYAIYLSHRGLTKEQFRATLGLTTLASISLRLLAFVASGLLLDRQVWLAAMAVVPAGLAAIWIAKRVYLRISREKLLRAVSFLLLISGGSLVARALGA